MPHLTFWIIDRNEGTQLHVHQNVLCVLCPTGQQAPEQWRLCSDSSFVHPHSGGPLTYAGASERCWTGVTGKFTLYYGFNWGPADTVCIWVCNEYFAIIPQKNEAFEIAQVPLWISNSFCWVKATGSKIHNKQSLTQLPIWLYSNPTLKKCACTSSA